MPILPGSPEPVHAHPSTDEIRIADALAYANDARDSMAPYPGFGWDDPDDDAMPARVVQSGTFVAFIAFPFEAEGDPYPDDFEAMGFDRAEYRSGITTDGGARWE